MTTTHDLQAPKRPVNLTLNEDLVLQVRGLTDNLSAVVEKLLTDYVAYAHLQQTEKTKAADATCEAWNNFNRKHGSFADEYVNL